MDIFAAILREYAKLLAEVIPYFFLGTLFAAALSTYLKPEHAYRLLNRNAFSVLAASVLAAVLPGCSCATMPMAEGLKRRGAKLGTVTAFTMMSPLLAPHTLLLTYAVLGWKFALGRLIIPFLFIPPLGILLNLAERHFDFRLNELPLAPCSCGSECEDCKSPGFWHSFREISISLGKYFLLGLVIAALFSVLVPEDAIPRYIGTSSAAAYLLAVLVGIPLYVCEGEEVPITYALLSRGIGAGPAFAFLLGSVGTCIPTMLMSRKVIGTRATFVYIITWFGFAILAGVIFASLFKGG